MLAHAQRLLQGPDHERHHGAQAHRLVDHGLHVLLALAFVDLGGQPRQLVGVAHQALDRPRHRGRGRLVARQQQRHQLVAQFRVAHPHALLVARAQQQREYVGALPEVLLLATAREPA